MHIDATPAEAQTILKAMRAVAAAGAAITAADRTSVVAAARYIFQIELSPDLAGLAPPRPEELKALAARPDLATEAVCFATVMAFVDGTLDDAKLSAVASLAATLGVKADFVDDIAEVAQGHLRSATAHMIRANLESLTGKPWDTDDAMPWLMPYKTKPDPALAARFHTLLDLPKETFGHAFAAFYRAQFRVRRAARFVASARGLRHLTARRGSGLDLHRRNASQRSHVGPRSAGDFQLASGHSAQ